MRHYFIPSTGAVGSLICSLCIHHSSVSDSNAADLSGDGGKRSADCVLSISDLEIGFFFAFLTQDNKNVRPSFTWVSGRLFGLYWYHFAENIWWLKQFRSGVIKLFFCCLYENNNKNE